MTRYCLVCGRELAPHQKKFCSRECHLTSRDLAPRRQGAAQRYPELHDPVWLSARIAAGGTATTIAAEVGCARETVRFAMQKFELEPLSPTWGRQPAKKISLPPVLAAKLGLTEVT